MQSTSSGACTVASRSARRRKTSCAFSARWNRSSAKDLFSQPEPGSSEARRFIRSEVGYAYEDVLFWLAPNDAERPAERRAVAGFQVTSAGAPTARGVEVGDDLDDVRASYPEIRCGDAAAGESPIRGNTTFPYCSGRVAPDRWIWFGGDPVANISVSRARFIDA
jgi:hypothetical protein